MNTTEIWTQFEARMREIKDLDGVLGLLGWDEETYAPKAARPGRGRQSATLESIRHQRLIDPALGGWMDALEADPALEGERRRMLERVRRRRDRAAKVPEALVKAIAQARSEALGAWQDARKANDFPAFRPHLTTMLRLLRERAEALADGAPGSGVERLYDALLDEHEPGMTTARLRPMLEDLRTGLVALVRAISGAPRPDRRFLAGDFDTEKQFVFTISVLGDLGFDLERGRQDRSAHPFSQSCGEDDVRLTTRLFANNPLSAIYSTVHEAGHGMYEQGFSPAHFGTALADAPSTGLHESQSRLWENQVARSRGFWVHYLPKLAAVFPSQLRGVGVDDFHRAVNFVEPGLVRVEADEVTYNLHILLRFNIELALLGGDLPPGELPAAWNARMQSDLGVLPPTDADGCLQDIHWAWGAIGYFPTYTIGNLYSAQLMKAFERQHPAAWSEIEAGRFGTLLGWLREKIHRRGYLESAEETVRAATGAGMSVTPFLEYLETKYRALYRLS